MNVYHVTVREAAKDGWIVFRKHVEAKSHGQAAERAMRHLGGYERVVTRVRFAYNTSDPAYVNRIAY